MPVIIYESDKELLQLAAICSVQQPRVPAGSWMAAVIISKEPPGCGVANMHQQPLRDLP